MKISELVRQIVKAQGDRQEDLANELSVTQPTVSRWMAGAEPRGDKRDKLREIGLRLGLISDLTPTSGTRRRSTDGITAIPIVSWVSAGKLIETGAPIPDGPKLEMSGLPNGEYFALEVKGTSMDRQSPDRSIVVVNRRERTPVDGRSFIFCIKGETTYKVWHSNPPRLEPYSTDPVHKPIFLDKKQKVLVIGRVRRTILDL